MKTDGGVVVRGVGSSRYFRRGESRQCVLQLAFKAILSACADANVEPAEIDGLATFGNESTNPMRLMTMLGVKRLRHSSMYWGGGGGGVCGALELAASAVLTGQAKNVVVFRSIAQDNDTRFGEGAATPDLSDESRFLLPYGVLSPAQYFGLKMNRFFGKHHIDPAVCYEVVAASYHHARNNPNAVRSTNSIDRKTYEESRQIVSPLHIYDCCLETDGAAAIIVSAADGAPAAKNAHPVYLLSAKSGCELTQGSTLHNAMDFPSANFSQLSKELFEEAGLRPSEIDVLQSYENFSPAVVMSIIENGFCTAEEAGEFFTHDNLTAGGGLPLNTSGGHLAEGYLQGMALIVEAVKQLRGDSYNQVPDAKTSMVTGGPLTAPVSAAIFSSAPRL